VILFAVQAGRTRSEHVLLTAEAPTLLMGLRRRNKDAAKRWQSASAG
jgi:hypothetical protein